VSRKQEGDEQTEQNGRFFVYWVIHHFGQFLENERSSPNFLTTIYPGKNVPILTDMGWATFLGDFLQTHPGHPVRHQHGTI
jgi:hypothetical protein